MVTFGRYNEDMRAPQDRRKEIHNSKANTKCNNMTEVEKIKLGKYDLESKESWTFS